MFVEICWGNELQTVRIVLTDQMYQNFQIVRKLIEFVQIEESSEDYNCVDLSKFIIFSEFVGIWYCHTEDVTHNIKIKNRIDFTLFWFLYFIFWQKIFRNIRKRFFNFPGLVRD